MTLTHTYGFIGAGAMAEAIIRGLAVASRHVTLTASDPLALRRHVIHAAHPMVSVTDCNASVVGSSDVVILAVKPQSIQEALQSIAPVICPKRHLIVSIVAGVSTSLLEEVLPPRTRVVRTMPNIACKVGCVAGAVSHGSHATYRDVSTAINLVTAGGGHLIQVPETQMDAVTGLAGSGPAYMYTMLEAMTDGGVQAGLSHTIAKQLALETVKGAVEMMTQAGASPADLRTEVCSPGGTTIHGLYSLEKGGFRTSVVDAIVSSTERSRQLSQIH